VSIEGKDAAEKRELLKKCAMTTLSSKLVGGEKEFFGQMCVDAVMHLDQDLLDPRMIGVKKVMGGEFFLQFLFLPLYCMYFRISVWAIRLTSWFFSPPSGSMRESFLVDGVAFKKTFSYAGFEQQPKYFDNPTVLALNLELELKSEKDNAEVRLTDPAKYQEIVDAEWNIIYDKLAKCVESGAKVILSRLAIGDLATQYFADRGVFCAGRVAEEDLLRVTKSTGARIQTTVNDLTPDQMGTCEVFEEKQVGNERFNLFRGCPASKTCTLVLRGGAEQFIEEAARSLNDAIEIVRRAVKNAAIVPGGGAIDMELSRHLRDHARGIAGKGQLFINAFARALEIIPRQLCDNSGFDATDVLNKLRQKHALGDGSGVNFGVDVNTGGVIDAYEAFIWEPALVKINAIGAACEATCLILSIDETVRNPRSEGADGQPIHAPGEGRAGRTRQGARARDEALIRRRYLDIVAGSAFFS